MTHHRLILVLAALATPVLGGPVLADSTRADQILERFRDTAAAEGHVLIVAHRGAAFREGEEIVAENSLASLDRAIELGVDMVEIDVRRTSDGVFVVSHDETLDRATDCTGAVEEKTYADISTCRLKSGPARTVTEEVVPSLARFLDEARGRIMINLDNKVGAEALEGIYDVVEEAGMTDHVVTTIRANTPEDVETIAAAQAKLGPDVQLMPNVYDSHVSGIDQVELIHDRLDFEVMQVRNAYKGGPVTTDGGLLLSDTAKQMARENDVHLWINTLSTEPDQPDLRAGGRGDVRAVTRGDLDGTYGFWAAQGVTMIQTDEPELAIGYLQDKGLRKPYR